MDKLIYRSYKTVNGVRTQTGGVDIKPINYLYGDTGTVIGHQFTVASHGGWGDVLRASYTGKARAGYSCTLDPGSGSLSSKPIVPRDVEHTGEAFFNSTATAPNAMDKCASGWELSFTLAGYSTARHVFSSVEEFRCDNRTAGRGPGCVVPWFAQPMVYSKSRAPELASHVARAQASGLPGATLEHPLTRTTNQAVIDQNRTKACNDAPSVTGKSCDEYPVATSYQGLSAGGTRRTFDACSFSFPPQTGGSGVSVCMIDVDDQNYQGGTHTGFFKSNRVLDRDPFRVLIGD